MPTVFDTYNKEVTVDDKKVVHALSVTVTVLGRRKRVTVSDRLSLYPMIFSIRRSFLGQKNCKSSRIVTLTVVTATDRDCIIHLAGGSPQRTRAWYLPKLAGRVDPVGHGRPGDLRPSAAPCLPEYGRVHCRLLPCSAGLPKYVHTV